MKKLQNQPFVLIGVNSDEKEKLKEIISKNNLTWNSWADGPDGPIARLYQVRARPAIFIIDHKGIIRAINLRGKELEDLLNSLVSEAQNANH